VPLGAIFLRFVFGHPGDFARTGAVFNGFVLLDMGPLDVYPEIKPVVGQA